MPILTKVAEVQRLRAAKSKMTSISNNNKMIKNLLYTVSMRKHKIILKWASFRFILLLEKKNGSEISDLFDMNYPAWLTTKSHRFIAKLKLILLELRISYEDIQISEASEKVNNYLDSYFEKIESKKSRGKLISSSFYFNF